MTVLEQSGGLGHKYLGVELNLPELGPITLTSVLRAATETAVYRTSHPEVVVKVFDLDCGLEDEVSYGPYVAFQLEVANYEEIAPIAELRSAVPAFHGSGLDGERKFAYVAMEFLDGCDLQEWCDDAREGGYPVEWLSEFRRVVYHTVSILERFHENRIVVIDFKPENVLRLKDGSIRFVDMGAFFTARHLGETKEYMYSATPDYAELLIDSSNVESGVPLTEASDIFAVGVALFEMVTGESRLSIDPQTADAILDEGSIYLFRDSQVRDVWKAYPHLTGELPLVEAQLKDRRLLFAEVWHVLKGYLATAYEEWDSLGATERDELLVNTGVTFIREHLPEPLRWLADAIARSTALRSLRLESVNDLKAFLGEPIGEEQRGQLLAANGFVRYLQDLGSAEMFLDRLQSWDLRGQQGPSPWAIAVPACGAFLGEQADFTFVVATAVDAEDHTFYHLAGDETGAAEPVALSSLSDATGAFLL